MPLRIGLDARALNTAFIRGMGEYLFSLIRTISPLHDVSWSLYGNRPDQPFQRPPWGEIDRVALHDVPGNRLHVWEQMALPAQVRLHKLDVLHCTSTSLPLWQPVPTVVTIHDTIQWNTGEDMSPGFYRDRVLPAAYARCHGVITISNHSRNDILRLWPELAPKVTVIHHGVTAEYLNCPPAPNSDAVRDQGVTRPYLIYFGGSAPRKRLAWTLELFQALDRPDVDLVVCGVGEAQHTGFRDMVAPELQSRVLFLPFVPARDMPLLYQNAVAVLYPTLYEGFGFPAIQSQAVGTPIVLSGVSSLLELVGPTSIALPPDDRLAWLEACRTLVDKRAVGCVPDEASRDWARRFSWDRAAQATWQVYQEAARRGRPRAV